MNKNQAIKQVTEIVTKYNLTTTDIPILKAGGKVKFGKTEGKIEKYFATILGYVGAVMLLFGIIFILSLFWSDISQLSRTLIVSFAGVASFSMGLFFTIKKNLVHTATGYFGIASVLIPSGIFLILDNFHNFLTANFQIISCLVFLGLSVYYFLLDKFFKNTIIHLFAWFYLALSLCAMVLYFASEFEYISYRVWCFIFFLFSAILLSFAHKIKAKRPVTSQVMELAGVPFYMIVIWAGITKNRFTDLLFCFVILSIIYLGQRMNNKIYLCFGFCGMAIYASYINSRYFPNLISWPIFLVIAGTIISITAAYLQMRKPKN
jgi:hypothetical protein